MATIEQLYNHFKTLVGQITYDQDDIDSKLDEKVDKVTGKGLSTEDYTTAEKTKLAGIEEEANKTVVDAELSTTSENPVQNKTIKAALDEKVDKETGKGLSTEDYTTAEKTKLAGIEEEANKTIVDNTLSTTSENPVQNKIVKGAVDDLTTEVARKANSADLHTIATTGSYDDLEDVPATFTPSAHTQASSTITDTNTYTNIANVSGTQESINTAIDAKLGSLLRVELVEVVTTLPTASADTKNALYLVPEQTSKSNDNYEVYVTVEDDGSYEWEKIDTARIDLTNYVTTDDSRLTDARTPLSHTHGNITNDGAIGNASNKMVVTGTNGVLTTSEMVTEMDTVIQDLINYGDD